MSTIERVCFWFVAAPAMILMNWIGMDLQPPEAKETRP